MKKNINLGIIGFGSWGRALHSVASKNLSDDCIKILEKNNAVLDDLDTLLVSASSTNVDNILNVLNFNRYKGSIIIATKGIYADGRLLTKVFKEICTYSKIAVLSGPNYAHEVISGKKTYTTIASEDDDFLELVSSIFNTDSFVCIKSKEIIAVQLYGALKNVIAIASGIGIAMCFGENWRAAMIVSAVSEIESIIKMYDPLYTGSFISVYGLGDLFLTASSSTSRNTNFGIEYAKNPASLEIFLSATTIEGFYTIRNMKNILDKNKDLKFFHSLYNILLNSQDINLLLSI